jgi:alpha-L-rhamnosidase
MKIISSILLCVLSFSLMATDPEVVSLTADYKVNPLGIDDPAPRLGWKIRSERRNTMQDSYEIRAASDPDHLRKGRHLIWESGKVETAASIHVKYGGPAPDPFRRIYWQVRITDNHGKTSDWSEVAWWETGLMEGTPWGADWIGSGWEEDPLKSEPSPYLRKEFEAGGQVARARLYITGLGLYQAEINGRRVGDQQFTPGWTSYHHRIQYQTYDVTDLIREGGNALGIILGDGWYRGNIGWQSHRNAYGKKLSALARLAISYNDGTTEVIATDGTWKSSTGPIRQSDIYNGEIYDAGMELEGWSSPDFDDENWIAVKAMDAPGAALITPEGPPVRVVEELEPVSIEKTDGGWLVDMGQNMVGWIRIAAHGHRGDTLTLRHAEVLDRSITIIFALPAPRMSISSRVGPRKYSSRISPSTDSGTCW